MQLVLVVLLIGVLPIGSILIEWLFFPNQPGLLVLVGKWFVFWAVGCRLLTAGFKQMTDPSYTAETIFRISDKSAQKIVMELGFANVSMGTLAVLSIVNGAWVTPAAIVGVLFFALAGGKHVMNSERTQPENIALWSDLFIALVLAVYLVAIALQR